MSQKAWLKSQSDEATTSSSETWLLLLETGHKPQIRFATTSAGKTEDEPAFWSIHVMNVPKEPRHAIRVMRLHEGLSNMKLVTHVIGLLLASYALICYLGCVPFITVGYICLVVPFNMYSHMRKTLVRSEEGCRKCICQQESHNTVKDAMRVTFTFELYDQKLEIAP